LGVQTCSIDNDASKASVNLGAILRSLGVRVGAERGLRAGEPSGAGFLLRDRIRCALRDFESPVKLGVDFAALRASVYFGRSRLAIRLEPCLYRPLPGEGPQVAPAKLRRIERESTLPVVFQYRDRKNGRIVADVVRIGKGTPRGWNPPSRNA
jgi:hypothetical protein